MKRTITVSLAAALLAVATFDRPRLVCGQA